MRIMRLINLIFLFCLLNYNRNNFHAQINIIEINNQKWCKENLVVKKFRNGDPIPEAKTDDDWRKAYNDGKPAWCYYNNNSKNESKGILYNWFAISDSRGLAPEGFHVPTIDDVEELINFVGEDAGYKTKSITNWEGLVRVYQIDKCKEKNENTPYIDISESCYNFIIKNSSSSVNRICKDVYIGCGNNKFNLEVKPFGLRYFNGSFHGNFSEKFFNQNSKDEFDFDCDLVQILSILGITLSENSIKRTTEGTQVYIKNEFDEFKHEVFFWTNSESGVNSAHYWRYNYRETEIIRSTGSKGNGYVVKLLKD